MNPPALQRIHQVVDLRATAWSPWGTSPLYPEGARAKFTVSFLPRQPFDFLIAGHRYLFKYPNRRYPWQYWGEVFAYRLGVLVGVPVPPAHVALDEEGQPGALIEWFYTRGYEHHSGGDLLLERDPLYDRDDGLKIGHAHAFEDVCAALEANRVEAWKPDLIKVLTFDALIANHDRHQDNWGIYGLATPGAVARLTPAYDNGTSLALERVEARLPGCLTSKFLEDHTMGKNATHHMRIRRDDVRQAGCFRLIEHFLEQEPHLAPLVRQITDFKDSDVQAILDNLCAFKVPSALTPMRAKLMHAIVTTRRRHLTALAR